MSSKHIPGPWVIDKVSGGWGVRAPNWGYVAIHDTSGLPHFDERQEANRRLIAAAPDLLEALVIAREYAAYAQAEPGDLALIDAAISKATGGAQ
ncbi:hypothetical protein [Stenotrophomonas maltophilia]|uniref:hypothetical protein n=1 Tax=Stenotrophomonas maltophilia TaxID=40324 RepID=UPI00209B0EED|nr:hypothetical protein [Stenotrophomonas maltophilia]MCO7494743.1 hypothetical protein [Stenotrophomonas maltophilia]